MRTYHLDHGTIAVEYALLIGLIAVVIIATVTLLGLEAIDLFAVEFP